MHTPKAILNLNKFKFFFFSNFLCKYSLKFFLPYSRKLFLINKRFNGTNFHKLIMFYKPFYKTKIIFYEYKSFIHIKNLILISKFVCTCVHKFITLKTSI